MFLVRTSYAAGIFLYTRLCAAFSRFCTSVPLENMRNLLDWVERVNKALFMQFDKRFDG